MHKFENKIQLSFILYYFDLITLVIHKVDKFLKPFVCFEPSYVS